nr:Ig-like domain-containing protein [uncultured Lachnoclostridium sp.]
MKFKNRRKIACFLLCMVMVFNLFPIMNTEGEVIITPMVESAQAADVVMPTGILYFKDGQQDYTNNALIEVKSGILNLTIGHSSAALPSSATVKWVTESTDSAVIEVKPKASSKYDAEIVAVGPGYSQLGAIVTYGGYDYRIDCTIHVPLKLADGQSKNGFFGLLTTFLNDSSEYGLQLKDSNNYLLKVKYPKYKSAYDNNFDVIVNEGEAVTETTPPSLRFESSNVDVVTVDQNGVVTANGAGYSIITIETITKYNNIKDTIKLPVVVAPTGKISGTSNMSGDFSYTATTPSFVLETNAVKASNLVWEFHKDTITGEKIPIGNSKLLDVNISEIGPAVTFRNAKAGTYVITARPTDVYLETNGTVQKLIFTVHVPLVFNHKEITMNVGDYYNIYDNSSMQEADWYRYSTSDVNIATVDANGVIQAKSAGDVIITMEATNSNPFKDDPQHKTKTLMVKVLDGLGLNYNNATIYTGSSLQLVLTSSSKEPVKWESSNTGIATVDKDGVVKGVAPGECIITVSQVVNGITKKLQCKIKVIQSVNKITLSPSEAKVGIGDFLTINAIIEPKLNDVKLHWVSSDEKVLKIVDSGNLSATIQGVGGGVAVVSAINKDNIVVGSCLVRVYQPIEKITLSDTLVKVPLSNGSFQLFATIEPLAAKDEPIVWRSSDESVLTVDQNGKVTLKKAGNAAIIVTSANNANVQATCNVTVTKAVTGVSLDYKTKDMYVGETFRLTYTVKPADSHNAAVTWISTNTSVATVDSTGLVTARAVGSTTIILKTIDGGYLATCIVNVSRTATAVKLDVTKLTLNVGDYYYFQTTLTPADSNEKNLSWESSDKSVATVSKNGKITAKGAGQCIILVKTKSGSTGYCSVTVLQPTTGIKLSSKEETIRVGDVLELEATVLPEGKVSQDVTWSSSNESVAKVDKYGRVTGVAGGITLIMVESEDGFKEYCTVTVEEYVKEIKLNETYYKLGLGKTFQLVATIEGKTASNKELRWTSSNKSIVSVDKNGKIKGLKLGTATITVYATDGSGAEASCTVRVSRLVTSIDLNTNYITLVQGKSYNLKATVKPDNATYKKPLYSSSNSNIAIVNKNGVITGIEPGNTIVTVKANDSSGISAICYVRVIAPVPSTGITAQESEVIMSPGETKTVRISMVPSNSTDSYTWSSDNPVVASVNESTGRILAKEVGTANLTVMTESGRRATITVYVVGLSKTNLEVETYSSERLRVDVGSTSNLTVRWDVDNQNIATVENGLVTGRKIGTTTVYAVVNGRRLACKVNVVKIGSAGQ